MKRKEIKWRREGRRVMTGRQDGVIFRIWTPYDAPEKGYSVSSNDTKGRGRGINTADHKTFPTWEAAVEFCQQIMVGEVDLETMRAEFDAAEAITRAWNNLTDTMAAAAEVFTAWIKTVAEEIQARNELKTAVRWASAYNRPLAYRYRHTKKKRTRKKYAKRILTWYREEVL